MKTIRTDYRLLILIPCIVKAFTTFLLAIDLHEHTPDVGYSIKPSKLAR